MTRWPELVTALAGAMVVACFASAGETVLAESTFDDGPDGWTLTVSTEWDPSLGNPGGCLFGSVAEPTNTTAMVFASDEFLGDWSSLDGGNGELRFDHALFSLGGGEVLEVFPLNIVISGPGGVARWSGPVIDEPTPYQTFALPIAQSEWEVLEGDWASIIADVQSVRFPLELISNTEKPEDSQAIDNVRLVQLAPTCLGDVNADGSVDLADLNLVLANFGSATTSGDANGDGQVDLADLNIVLGNFGTDCD